MPRIRSLVTTVEIDVVQRAHDCQGNPKHRLTKGERRLAVKMERGWDYYCLNCGRTIIGRDVAKLQKLQEAIDAGRDMKAENLDAPVVA